MGRDPHEIKRLNGNIDHNPSCRGHTSPGSRTFSRPKHPWWYFKAKAEARKRQAATQEENRW